MRVKTYVISVLIALAVGGLAALLTGDNMMLYAEIITPPLAPPAVLFPIVWTILYVLMGIGAARVYLNRDKHGKKVADALSVYVVQLVVNFFWSIIFFNMRAFLSAFLWLVLLWIAVLSMIVKFKKVDKIAAVINIPYLVWVTFAGYLNYMIFVLNM